MNDTETRVRRAEPAAENEAGRSRQLSHDAGAEPARSAVDSATNGDDNERSDDNAGEPAGRDANPREFGGRKGPDPVRYGDWEKNGRCIDF